jgi:para-aminobenzoate synthetase/4-amino-4-deoxychorismate lyase
VPATEPQLELITAFSADRSRGVFETLLVVDGRAVAAGRHLARLQASLEALYGLALPQGAQAGLAEAAAGYALARLRLKVVAQPTAPAAVGFEVERIDPAIVAPLAEATLATVRVGGGAGPHKLIDRSWFEQIEALAGAGVRPLLVANSGALLETTRANVFLLRDGVLATPPLGGSILAGTVRTAVLEHARQLGIEAHERPLTLRQLEEADMVLLSGSVRLLERARVRDGHGASVRAAARLAGALAAAAGM